MFASPERSSLRRVDVQLVIAFLVVALLPAGGVGALLTWRSAEIADTYVSEHVQQTANAYAAGLDLFLERHRGRLKDIDVVEIDEDQLTERVRADRSLEALWMPAEGLSSKQPAAPWATRACSSMGSQDSSFVTHAGEGHAHQVVIFVVHDGRPVCAQVDFTVHQEMMSGQADSALGGSAYIVDRNGVVVCHAFDENEPHVARGAVLSPVVGEVAGRAQPWSGHVRQGGEVAFGAFATAAELPWGVWVQAPRDQAMAPFTTGMFQGLGLAGLVALAAAGIAVWWARRLASPIQALSLAAERMAAGARGVVVPATGPSEVQALARQFNSMSETVDLAQQELEARVEERTQELSRAYARLAHQEKMVSVGTLAAGIAHEIGNPLASMSSELEMLELRWDADDARGAIPVLREQVSRMSRMLRELVEFGRPASAEVGEIHVHNVIDEVVRLLRHDPRSRGITISTQCPQDLVVATGRDQVVQILVNLGLNALDAAGANGHVQVAAARDSGGLVRISVSDDGPGVPEEDRSRVFDPFFTTKDPGRGTGLGLLVSEQVAQGLGGGLELTSSPSGGACFSLVLRPVPDQEAS